MRATISVDVPLCSYWKETCPSSSPALMIDTFTLVKDLVASCRSATNALRGIASELADEVEVVRLQDRRREVGNLMCSML